MKIQRMIQATAAVAVSLGALALAPAAHARSDVVWSVGISSPGVAVGVSNAYPVYTQPAPVYVQPAPVYVQPRPVYVYPRPVIYQQPVYVQPAPVYYGPPPRWHRHHGHGHGYGHGWGR